MKKTIQSAALLLAILNTHLVTVFAQGPLTPPGAPAPTMKSLDQIEARTAITNTSSLATISQPGAYYLTHNLTVSTGDAIVITTNNVTLNLNGFTIASTAASANGTAINLANPATNTDITILNGHIKGGVTNNGTTYGGPGFANGISITGNPAQSLNVHVSDISVSGCSGNAIYLTGAVFNNYSTVVEACTVQTIGNDGITAGVIVHSTAYNCGNDAIFCNVATDCIGISIGFGGTGVGSYVNANNCVGINTSNGYGVQALGSAINCLGQSVSGYGLTALIATSCHGVSTSGTALNVTHNLNTF